MSLHQEAFCLMVYASNDGRREVLWNSRDGVTPFVISSVDGKKEMKHVNWRGDSYLPYNVPLVGSRVFMDATIEDYTESRKKFVDQYWDPPQRVDLMLNLQERWDTKRDAIMDLAQGDFDHHGGHAPWVNVVTEEMRKMFQRRADEMVKRVAAMGGRYA